MTRASEQSQLIEICILAGGLGRRMGRDKTRVRLGTSTMLGRIRAAVIEAGFKARVIRRDLVPRCGPLGGIYTGLKTTSAAGVMFLACDMPFLSGKLLRFVAEKGVTAARVRPVFTKGPNGIGFPVLLPKEAADIVLAAIKAGTLSLSSLCAQFGSPTAAVPAELRGQLENINTAEELERAKQELRLQRGADLTRGKAACRWSEP